MANEKNLPPVEYLDIDGDTQSAAAAAMSLTSVLTPPDDAVVATDAKGNRYERWTERAIIERTWRETTVSGLVQSVVQVKFRAGGKNQHIKMWFRHLLDYGLISGTASEEQREKHDYMNNKTITALTSLFTATGYAPTSPGLKGTLLMHMFPPKGELGAKAPIVGKDVMVNLCNSPNSGAGAKTDRQTQADTYSPPPTPKSV
jgi:hypothetical protein